MQNGSYLTREQILAKKLVFEEVSVPEWGGTTRVRELTAAESEEYQRRITRLRQEIRGRGRKREVHLEIESHVEKAMVILCGLTMVDGDGNRLFSEAQVQELATVSRKALARVYAVSERLSGLNEEAVEGEGKDSEPIVGDEKPSELPELAAASQPENSSIG